MDEKSKNQSIQSKKSQKSFLKEILKGGVRGIAILVLFVLILGLWVGAMMWKEKDPSAGAGVGWLIAFFLGGTGLPWILYGHGFYVFGIDLGNVMMVAGTVINFTLGGAVIYGLDYDFKKTKIFLLTIFVLAGIGFLVNDKMNSDRAYQKELKKIQHEMKKSNQQLSLVPIENKILNLINKMKKYPFIYTRSEEVSSRYLQAVRFLKDLYILEGKYEKAQQCYEEALYYFQKMSKIPSSFDQDDWEESYVFFLLITGQYEKAYQAHNPSLEKKIAWYSKNSKVFGMCASLLEERAMFRLFVHDYVGARTDLLAARSYLDRAEVEEKRRKEESLRLGKKLDLVDQVERREVKLDFESWGALPESLDKMYGIFREYDKESPDQRIIEETSYKNWEKHGFSIKRDKFGSSEVRVFDRGQEIIVFKQVKFL